MATIQLWKINCLLILCYYVTAIPTCKYKNKLETTVVCTNSNDSDYKLVRGLVSDNNKTTSISLQDCRISSVEYESFENLYALRYLDLSQNQISALKLGVLDGFNEVLYLNLSHNSLTEFPLGLFDESPNLEVLDLSANRLNNLELGIFDPLKKLKYLTLSSNNLIGKELNPYIFDQSPDINYIDFSYNDMSNAPDTLLHAFRNLDHLILTKSLIKEVPVFATRENLRTLKNLILSGNEISKLVNTTTFINLQNLEKLDISDNILDVIHEDVFRPLKKLKIIILRGNKIEQLPEKLFTNLKYLSNIDLSHNQITAVPIEAFRGTSVKNLNLSNNRFTYLLDNFSLELRNSGAKLNKFYFNQNPWQCSCLMDLLNEVKKLDITYNSLNYDGKYPVCVTSKIFNCQRHDDVNSIFTDLYDSIVSPWDYLISKGMLS